MHSPIKFCQAETGSTPVSGWFDQVLESTAMRIVAVVVAVVWMVSTEVGVGKQEKEAEREERAAERAERVAEMAERRGLRDGGGTEPGGREEAGSGGEWGSENTLEESVELFFLSFFCNRNKSQFFLL